MPYLRNKKGLVINPAESPQKAAFNEILIAELTPKVQIDFPYNINTDIVTTIVTGSGLATQSSSKAILQTQASTSSTAQLASKRVIKYDPGQGAVARFTALFSNGSAGSQQEIGIGDATDGFFFGYNGTSLGILRRRNGTDIWTRREDWNGDNADGKSELPKINFTLGNVYQIRYQWLGFGLISFAMENPEDGQFTTVHDLRYANSTNLPSVFNPTLPLCAKVVNTTNNTDIKLETSSMAGFVEGKEEKLGPKKSIIHTKTALTTALTNIITIRNETSFQTKTNRVDVNLDFFSAAVEGTKPAELKIVKNPTLGGTPSYKSINTATSVIAYDTSGTTVTGGNTLFSFALAKADGVELNLADLNIDLIPGDTLSISGRATSGTTDGTGAFSWIERF